MIFDFPQADVSIKRKDYGGKAEFVVIWHGLPSWPFLVAGELYRLVFRHPTRALGILRECKVIDYDKARDIVVMGRLPWWKKA
jgi:hypothetical protein